MKLVYTLAVILLAFNVNAQLTNGMVAHWEFSGNANDATSNGHNGTANNVTYTAGKAGIANTAALFNGTSSYVGVPYQTSLNTSKFSICAVIKPTGYYTGLCQVNAVLRRGGQYQAGSYAMDFWDNPFDNSCNVVDTGKNVFGGYAGTVTVSTANTVWRYSPTIVTQTWYCVVVTYDDTAFRMYIDGVLKHTVPKTGGSTGTSTEGLAIGANRFSNYTQYPYWLNGVIDDLRLYNRALSPAEISSFCSLFDTTIAITTNLSGKQLCGDDTFHLSYTVSNNFGSSNTFSAQLSDATGSFATPQNIGTISSATAGTIICTTPTGLTPGTGYRVRIVSSNPVRNSDVSATFGIYPTLTPSATIAATPSGPVAANQYITFVATPVDAGISPSFQWYRNGTSIPGATDDTLYINTLNDSDVIHVVVASSNPCPANLTAQSDSIVVRILSSVHELKLDNLNLYPNPANNHITITADNVTDDLLLELVNSIGQIVHRRYAAPANRRIAETVETGNMASGIYILRISSNGYQRNTRFTVRH